MNVEVISVIFGSVTAQIEEIQPDLITAQVKSSFKNNAQLFQQLADQLDTLRITASTITDTATPSEDVLNKYLKAQDGQAIEEIFRDVITVLRGLEQHLKTKILGGGRSLVSKFKSSKRSNQAVQTLIVLQTQLGARILAMELILTVMTVITDAAGEPEASPWVLGHSLAGVQDKIGPLQDTAASMRRNKEEEKESLKTADLYDRLVATIAKPLHESFSESHPEAAKIAASGIKPAAPTARWDFASYIGDRDTAQVESFLHQGLNPNVRFDNQITPLHLAAVSGSPDIVRALIKAGARLDLLSTPVGDTPLYSACMAGHLEAVRVFVDAGADINCTTGTGHRSPLYGACAMGKRAVAEYLLDQKGIDISIVDLNGYSPLDVATMQGHVHVARFLLEREVFKEDPLVLQRALGSAAGVGQMEILQLLLDRGVAVNSVDHKKCTPLYRATATGQVDALTYLVNRGADINAKNTPSAQTCVFGAVLHQQPAILTRLLELGADPNIPNNKTLTPLHWAAEAKYTEMVRALLAHGADPTAQITLAESEGPLAGQQGRTPLHLAAVLGHVDVIQILLDKGADINSAATDGFTPLAIAAMFDKLDAVKVLVKRGADVNMPTAGGDTVIFTTIFRRLVDVTKFLLENGADCSVVNDKGSTPLYIATLIGDLDMVKLLLDHGADPNGPPMTAKGSGPLSMAAQKNHLAIATLLLDRGADATTKKYYKDNFVTPLLMAADDGYLEMTQLLVKRGADLGAANCNGTTPLHAAASNGHYPVVRYLLGQGVDPSPRLNEGNATPLMMAAHEGHADLIDLFAEAGVDLNACNDEGTAIEFAAEQGHGEFVKKLVARGVDPEQKDSYGKSALSVAREEGSAEMVALLEELIRVRGVK
ncbi:hypothetical protein FQN55_001142 [Onygenales sp. PD_40]|nr:hypothetical protein FQN55_001142 [Onygenales sp. PD_40]KAK2783210.1 hypothetical protein FQN51_004448 [Onygenales sp. PD_10]KAK2792012.1 hypothetical protein FQN52_004118 [Onygenales sp. PD_12]